MIQCRIDWQRGEADFLNLRYHRSHRWTFDGGAVVVASSSPEIVPVPMSDETAVDPEEAIVASLSSCHMLWFLAIAAKGGFTVDSYRDDPCGVMSRNERGRLFVSDVTLRPNVTFGGASRPSDEQLAKMHHDAHGECFLANSVTSVIRVEPQNQAPDSSR